jgi:hypothetical protein
MRLRSIGVIAFLLSASVALADGCYIPERAVRKIPEIVAQRAVLSWKDGVETLVISSALDSEAQKLGWIIPVPAVPDTIEKATPGALKTLDFCIQPWIIHDLSRGVSAAIVAVLVCNVVVATWLFDRKRFGCLLSLLLLLVVLNALTLSAMAPVGGGMVTRASEVRVEKTAKVGSYAISVLRPSQPDGLGGWLAANGFAPLPKAASKITAEYVSQGWVFAAIKLARSESGANTPHPIKLVFPSKEAVFPMKLTAIAGGKPKFELFVIGGERASCDILEEKFCDRFLKKDSKQWSDFEGGAATGCNIGHSAICSVMWDGCVLTKFVASVDAASMTKDIRFAWKPFRSHQEHFFTQYGARCLGWVLFVVVIGSWNIASMRDYARGLIQPKGFTRYFVRRLVPGVACATIIAGICFALLPKLDDSDVHVSPRWPFFESQDYQDILQGRSEVLNRTEAEIADFLLDKTRRFALAKSPRRNVITGAELKVEDSPGNFTVEKQANQVIIREYDRIGDAVHFVFPIKAAGSPDQPDPATGSGRRVKP